MQIVSLALRSEHKKPSAECRSVRARSLLPTRRGAQKQRREEQREAAVELAGVL
jgi:hypothetical protein